jgi:hypothetical protein
VTQYTRVLDISSVPVRCVLVETCISVVIGGLRKVEASGYYREEFLVSLRSMLVGTRRSPTVYSCERT